MAPLRNHCCSGKTVSYYIFWVCVYSLNCPVRKAHIVICGPSGCTYFSTLSHKLQDFRGGGTLTEHKMCVLIFSTIFACSIFHSTRTVREMTTNVHRSARKVPITVIRFEQNVNFHDRFPKKNNQISLKSVQWEPSCSIRTTGRTDGQTDMAKLIPAFSDF